MFQSSCKSALRGLTAVSVTAGLLMAMPVLADPPGGRGKGKPGGDRERGGDSLSIDIHIDTGNRTLIQDYYGGLAARGHCPPGLAKKQNGCMPPGQAKKWSKGRRLGSEVVFYDLPPDLYGRLHVPAGYRYVRVGADILMIAVGTGLVVDAVEDLMRM